MKLPLLVFSTSGFAGARFRASPLIDGNRAATQAVLSSPTPAIVLQPTVYLENLRVPLFVPRLASEGVLDYPPLPTSQVVSWVSQLDQAEIAVAAMRRPDLAGRAFEIASAGALTGDELASALSTAFGRTVHFEPTEPNDFGARVAKVLGNPPLAPLLADMYDAVRAVGSHGLLIDTDALGIIFNVTLRSVRDRIKAWRDQ